MPGNLATAKRPREDKYTTAGVEPLSSTRRATLGLSTPGTLTVGTLTESPPTICINAAGRFTGFDNELLRAIAKKLGLRIQFVGTDFFGLLAQVAAGRFDVGSASITATDARRRTVGFTNGYDFGYISLVVPAGSGITGFRRPGPRSAHRRGAGHRARTTTSSTPCSLHPVKFPDYNHRLRQPEDPPDRRVGGAVADALNAAQARRPGGDHRATPSAWTTSWPTRWPRTTSR